MSVAPPDTNDHRARIVFSFGHFRLCPRERLFEKAGRRVELGGRMFELLAALLERAGETVPKRDLLSRIWPDMIVDEVSLRVQIAALRKVLGDGAERDRFIVNNSGKGYCFVAQVTRVADPVEMQDRTTSDQRTLPILTSRIIGRDDEIATITRQLLHTRFVTITGPGGIGKTTLAVSVAARLAETFGEAVRFISLSALKDPAFVAGFIASAFGITIGTNDPTLHVIDHLRDGRMLVVLDCCEHVIEETAALAERLVREAPGVYLLTTSREPLRVQTEQVLRLFPLELPTVMANFTAEEALVFPAVQLFIERLEARADSFLFEDSSASAVVNICQRLDGIPLAIELAAARAGVFGINAVEDGLQNLFAFLTRGKRTALPRHQTLRATLDWSYHLLSSREQAVMRRLSVFRGSFVLDTAIAICAVGDVASGEAQQAIGNLVSKSLLSSTDRGERMHYKFLDTTRAYAAEKLGETAEVGEIQRHHALWCISIFEQADVVHEVIPEPKNWLEQYGVMIDDVRAAHDWAFQHPGDAAIGVAIMALSAPLWFAMLLMDEYCVRAEVALGHIKQSGLERSKHEMMLRLAHGTALFHSRGARTAMAIAAARVLAIAEIAGEVTYQLRALWQLARERTTVGDYRGALQYCERFEIASRLSSDIKTTLMSDRMMALALFLVGRLAEARTVAERVVKHSPIMSRSMRMGFNEHEHHIVSHSHLARILWVSGFSDRAIAVADHGVERGLLLGYAPLTCHILCYAAIPIAFWSGDDVARGRYIGLLKQQVLGMPNGYWQLWLSFFERIVADDGSPNGKADLVALLDESKVALMADAVGTIRADLVTTQALARALEDGSRWNAPELLRAHGENLCRTGNIEQAEVQFLHAISLARKQGSLAWELRIANSLARLMIEDGRSAAATALVSATTDRFGEGFGTKDWRAAQAILTASCDNLDRDMSLSALQLDRGVNAV